MECFASISVKLGPAYCQVLAMACPMVTRPRDSMLHSDRGQLMLEAGEGTGRQTESSHPRKEPSGRHIQLPCSKWGPGVAGNLPICNRKPLLKSLYRPNKTYLYDAYPQGPPVGQSCSTYNAYLCSSRTGQLAVVRKAARGRDSSHSQWHLLGPKLKGDCFTPPSPTT